MHGGDVLVVVSAIEYEATVRTNYISSMFKKMC
jgi:hypothetical protein